MLSYEGFTFLILLFILAPIFGAITLLFLFIFEKRFDLLENRTKKMELEKELQQTLYNQLNQQIQPHFLFNTLNVILSLARLERTKELVRALEVFSQFLKFKYKTNEPMIPLREEIQYTEYYIEIQKLRFGARLSVTLHCDEEIRGANIPPFVLQTIVENAFKHGLERKVGDVCLYICIFRTQDAVVLQVFDNGMQTQVESAPDAEEKSGHGLDNIRRRMHLYFTSRARVHMASVHGVGTEVQVTWPFILSPDESEMSS